MVKPRNILIIFILNYLLLLLVSVFIEFVFVSNKAQEAQLMIRTAADMALEQVQSTDEFFTSGGGYFVNEYGVLENKNYVFKTRIQSGSQYVDGDSMYQIVAGSDNIETIYKNIYSENKIRDFIDENKKVLGITFTGAAFTYSGRQLTTTWCTVPTIMQMGYQGLWDSYNSNYVFDASKSVSVGISDINGQKVNSANKLDALSKSFELTHISKTLTDKNGNSVEYYMTPISLGVTYINEDLLQAFFMNNLDLLMRSKYAKGSYDLNSEECGNGVYKSVWLSDAVDEDSLRDSNPINNGSLTLLRGEEHSYNGYKYYDGLKPKVEYVVIDMYNNNYNSMLQQILGYKLQNGTLVNGTNLKNLDVTMNNSFKNIVGATGNYSTIFDHKFVVVAKVTFYADFIIPYETPSLREMRGRTPNNGTISGRTLFSAFSNVVSALTGNYVNIQNGYEVIDSELYDLYNGQLTVNGDTNRAALMYTTLFAVTP